MINVNRVIETQDKAIERWKKELIQTHDSNKDWILKVSLQEHDFFAIMEENHGFNYQLWHAEDRARRDDRGSDFVYWAKREIDWCNQQRNDRIEQMDTWIFEHYSPVLPKEARVNSETPGMIIDRLSILSLKIYHMAIQAQRQTADEIHRVRCHEKWQILMNQRRQLQFCLTDFLDGIQRKTTTFCSYQQFKMYNDKQLNPELYV